MAIMPKVFTYCGATVAGDAELATERLGNLMTEVAELEAKAKGYDAGYKNGHEAGVRAARSSYRATRELRDEHNKALEAKAALVPELGNELKHWMANYDEVVRKYRNVQETFQVLDAKATQRDKIEEELTAYYDGDLGRVYLIEAIRKILRPEKEEKL